MTPALTVLKKARQSPVLFLLLTLCLLLGSPLLWSKARVTFINPDTPGNPFWDQVTAVMQSAAEDLDIELTVLYGESNRMQSTEAALDAINASPKPDYLVYIYQVGQGRKILEAAEKAGVHSFLFNTDLPVPDKQELGGPGERFRFWLGHLIPDDRQAGEQLALILEQAARANHLQPSFVGFTGSRDSSAAQLRNEGLELALSKTGAPLNQLIVSNWDPTLTAEQAPILLKRFPEANVIWAASDSMALSTIPASRALGKVPGQSIFIGGVDWTEAGIEAVKSGELTVNMGGHFADGAWSLVMIHDHFHQVGNPEGYGTRYSRMTAITRDNIDRFTRLLADFDLSEVDFRRYSFEANPQQTDYQFSLEAVVSQPQP